MRRVGLFALMMALLIGIPAAGRAEEAPMPSEGPKELYEKGVAAMEAGRYEEALAAFEAILRFKPDMPVIHNLIGVVYVRDSKPELAKAAFEDAVRVDPKYAEAYFNLATLYMGEEEDKTVAAEYYRQAIEANPQYGKAHFGLGWIELLENDDAEAAVARFERVVELDPAFIEGHYGLAVSYLRLNKRAMALQPLSVLRSNNRYDLVERVEKMMEEPEEVPVEAAGLSPGAPVDEGEPPLGPSGMPAEETAEVPGDAAAPQEPYKPLVI